MKILGILCLFAISSSSLAATVLHAAEMDYPLAVTATESGTIFIGDRNLPGIWKVEDGKLSLYFEGSKKFRTPLNAVRCVAIDKQGKLLAGDSSTREVYRFDDAGKPVPLTEGGIGIPMAIAVNAAGDLLVADLELHRIWKVPQAGGKPELFVEVPAPRGVFIDGQDRLWIVSHGNDQVLRVTPDKKIEAVVKGRSFEFPHNIVVTSEGTPYVVDGYTKGVYKIVEGSAPETVVKGEPLDNPVGLALHGKDLLVADPRAKAIFRIDPAGKIAPIEMAPAAP